MKTRLLTLLFSICMLLGVCSLAGGAQSIGQKVFSKVVVKDGKTLVVLSNRYVELTFDPSRGGRCSSLRLLDTGEQVVEPAASGGLFIDHWAKYPYPSGLMHLPYQYKIVGDPKSRAGIELWVTVPPMGGGQGTQDAQGSARIATSPELIGLVVRKTIWLNASNNLITVTQQFENPTKESRGVAPYVQQAIIGARNYSWYMPSTRGVVMRTHRGLDGSEDIGPDWVREPTAGWMAVRNSDNNRTLLFAFDYNYLEKMYTCGSTAEWFMEVVPVGPSENLNLSYVIKPVSGFEGFAYGSKLIVADIQPDEVKGKIRVRHDIAAVSTELTGVQVEFTVVGWKSKEVIARQVFKNVKIGFQKSRQEFSFVPKRLSDGLVIKAVVRGRGVDEHYEYYYAGDKEENSRKLNSSRTVEGMAALAASESDIYLTKQPRKIKKIAKPDESSVARLDHKGCKVLVVFGLYTHILDIDGALGGFKNSRNEKAEITWINCPPDGAEGFPGNYGELFGYDTIVLSDVNFKALGAVGFEMLANYVLCGGSLLVTGGPYALGNGRFEDTVFPQMLPVELSGPFDLKWAGKGKSWEVAPAEAGSPILKGVSFVGKPQAFWNHWVTPKSGAQVVLVAGDKPALVVGSYGKGKVAVLTLSPTGEGQPRQTQWWDWDGWHTLLQNTITWLQSTPRLPDKSVGPTGEGVGATGGEELK